MEFSRSALVSSRLGFGELRHVAVTGSTNTDLVEEARLGSTAPAVLVTDHQSAGRGRLDRQWVDEGGALLVSIRLPIEPGAAGHVMPAVAAGIRHAVSVHTDDTILVKWPNDVVVSKFDDTRKLAGILAELVPEPDSVVVVGFGINLLAVDSQPQAISVIECGGVVDRDVLLAEILEGLRLRLDDPAAAHREVAAHSATIGERVRVELPGGQFLVGLASAIDGDGRLRVTDDSAEDHLISVGDVVHLRPVD